MSSAGANHPPGRPDPQLQEDLRETLQRERHRLQELFESAQSQLAEREAKLEREAAALAERERQLELRLTTLREREQRTLGDAQEQARAILEDAQRDSRELIFHATKRSEELEREMLAAEQELIVSRHSSEEHSRETLARAEREAELILTDARERAAAAGDRIVELMRLREGLLASVRETLSRFDETVARAEREEPPGLQELPADGVPPDASRESGEPAVHASG